MTWTKIKIQSAGRFEPSAERGLHRVWGGTQIDYKEGFLACQWQFTPKRVLLSVMGLRLPKGYRLYFQFLENCSMMTVRGVQS